MAYFQPPKLLPKQPLWELLKNNVVHSGYLSRPLKSLSGTDWHENYVVLFDGCMYIYKDGRGTEPTESVSLFGYNEVVQLLGRKGQQARKEKGKKDKKEKDKKEKDKKEKDENEKNEQKEQQGHHPEDEYCFALRSVQEAMANFTFAIPSEREFKDWMRYFNSQLKAAYGHGPSAARPRSVRDEALPAKPSQRAPAERQPHPKTAPAPAPAPAPARAPAPAPAPAPARAPARAPAPAPASRDIASADKVPQADKTYCFVEPGTVAWEDIYWECPKGVSPYPAISKKFMEINKEGTYLVKDDNMGDYALCVWIKGGTKKYKIYEKGVKFHIDPEIEFTDMMEMTYHYEKNHLPNHPGVKLVIPYSQA